MALLIKSLLGLLVAYLLLVIAAYYVQRRLMYFPDTARVTPASIGLANVTERVLETPDGERVIAWYAPARPGQPTILYFHGNGGSLEARSERVRKYVGRDHGMFMMTYRGYGGSTGVPSERANVADAKLAYDTLVNEGVRGGDIIVYGESLGSGVAVQVAAEREVGGLILDAPYTSTVDVAELAYPYLPARWLMTDRYETLRHLRELKAPLLVVHGEKDTIIPIAMGRRVHAAASGAAEIVTFPQAGHSDHHLYGSYDAIYAWIDRLRGNATRAGEVGAPRRVPQDHAPPG
jgi:pimeloyl-ACP methyl ester carboxylesterase